ncbi:sensor histidine kinase [Cohnella sp.]|uniref:sensor histidine kinase n=1 Tax=Cohnella sp. TaxID=1883426 RepID=UPI00356B3F48
MLSQTERQSERLVFKLVYRRILIFAAALLVVSILFGSLLFWRSQQYYSAVIHDKQVDRLRFVTDSFEKEIGSIKQMQYRVMLNENVDQIRYFYETASVFDRYRMIEGVKKELDTLRGSSRLVADVSLYFRSIERSIGSDGIDPLDRKRWDSMVGRYVGHGLLFSDKGRLLMVEALTTDAGSTGADTDCLLVVELDKEAIVQNLEYAQLTNEDVVVLVDLGSGQILSRTENSSKIRLPESDRISKGELLRDESYKLIASTSNALNADLYWLYIDNVNEGLMNRTFVILYCFLGVVLLLIGIGVLFSYRGAYYPLKILLEDAFWQVRNGNLKHRIQIAGNGPFVSLYRCFNDMVSRIDALVENDLKHQLLLSHAKLKQLQAQINPHFIYNSYYVLYRMIKMKDYENSITFCEHLGKFFEYITRDGQDDKRLSEEFGHAKVYAAIQSYRFRDRIVTEFGELPKEWAQVRLPRLILQPLLENVFNYVFEHVTPDEPGRLRVGFERRQGCLVILVENSGRIEDEALERIDALLGEGGPNGEVSALTNIDKRLRIYFDGQSGLRVSRSALGGLCVAISIPNLEEGEQLWGSGTILC